MTITHSILRVCRSCALVVATSGTLGLGLMAPAIAQTNDDGLAARVEQLEQQIVELQVTIGTLESLAKGRPSGTTSRASGGGSADVTQLEIQMRAMSGQIAALARDVRALQAGGGVQSAGSLTNNSYAKPVDTTTAGASNDGNDDLGGFGSVTVTPENNSGDSAASSDPIGNILSTELAAPEPEKKVASASALPPRAAYDKAYGYLLEQDYGAAEVAFGSFVGKHPKDKLAGNAQYWLGETHYVRGNYRAAANAFLKGYQNYKKSAKAPDSLLKLAMSLSRLGQKPTACATFDELTRRYPSAPAHVIRRSKAERQRAGC